MASSSSGNNINRDPAQLRSAKWFAPDDLRSFGHRSRMKQMGLGDADFRDKPIVAILNTWSDLNTCHSHFRERANDVRKRDSASRWLPRRSPGDELG